MESALRSRNISIVPREIKKNLNYSRKCPICLKKIRFGVELGFLKKVKRYPYPHVVLHGKPLHALVAYIDASFEIRGIETIQSVEIQRNSETFSEIIKKWSNPF